MGIVEYNNFLNSVEVAEESAAQAMEAFRNLKKEYPDIAIIETANKEKFLALLKTEGQVHENYTMSKEDLSNLDFSDFIFEGCRFEHTDFNNSNMDAIEFSSCCLDYAVFHKAFMECSCFRDCSCVETDFSNTHLLASYIEDSDWRKANVSGANLLEIEAHDWNVEDMIIDKNTSVGEGEFTNVEWSKTNVASLNISLNQVKYFLQSTNGGKFLNVYINYERSSFEQREDAILEALLETKKEYLESCSVNRSKESLTFISYASEQENIVKEFYDTQKSKFQLWMDTELIKHEQLRMQLENVISSCSKAAIFLSKEYMVKAWTRYEFYRLIEESHSRDLDIFILTESTEVKELVKDRIEKESNIRLIDTIDELIHNL